MPTGTSQRLRLAPDFGTRGQAAIPLVLQSVAFLQQSLRAERPSTTLRLGTSGALSFPPLGDGPGMMILVAPVLALHIRALLL